jgi:hypothetical protein
VNGNGPYVVFYIAAAVFVAASLVGRQLPIGKAVKMALAWIAIFVVAITIAVFLGAYF